MSIENMNNSINQEIPKTPEEQLGEFFDQTKGLKLKQELSSERYEEEKKEFIANGLAEEDINTMLEARTYEARFDPVTGLKNRRELFKRTSPKIKEFFGIPIDTEPSDEEWLEIIKNNNKDFSNKNFYIMMSDISFLGLVNDLVGHNSGDKLLKAISKRMQTIVGECFRHGGDEITGVFDLPTEKLEAMAKKAKKEISNIRDLPGLESSNLKPNIDIGFANFSEALKIYKELLVSGQEPQEMDKNVLRNLQNIWLEIADKRTSINKSRERIMVLIKRLNNGQEINGALTKAAYGIGQEKLKNLLDKYNAGDDIEKEINEFIKSKEIANLDKANLREKKLIELILRHLNIINEDEEKIIKPRMGERRKIGERRK